MSHTEVSDKLVRLSDASCFNHWGLLMNSRKCTKVNKQPNYDREFGKCLYERCIYGVYEPDVPFEIVISKSTQI